MAKEKIIFSLEVSKGVLRRGQKGHRTNRTGSERMIKPTRSATVPCAVARMGFQRHIINIFLDFAQPNTVENTDREGRRSASSCAECAVSLDVDGVGNSETRSAEIEGQKASRVGGGMINPGAVPAVTTAAVTKRGERRVDRCSSITPEPV